MGRDGAAEGRQFFFVLYVVVERGFEMWRETGFVVGKHTERMVGDSKCVEAPRWWGAERRFKQIQL